MPAAGTVCAMCSMERVTEIFHSSAMTNPVCHGPPGKPWTSSSTFSRPRSEASDSSRRFQDAAANLIALHTDEQCAEISLSKSVIAAAVDDLEENRSDQ